MSYHTSELENRQITSNKYQVKNQSTLAGVEISFDTKSDYQLSKNEISLLSENQSAVDGEEKAKLYLARIEGTPSVLHPPFQSKDI